MTIDIRKWDKHFASRPRSTEMVQMPRDVFDFLLETNEAYASMTGGDIATVASAQMLALDLLREVARGHHAGSPDAAV